MDMDRCVDPVDGETDSWCRWNMEWNPDMYCWTSLDAGFDVCSAE